MFSHDQNAKMASYSPTNSSETDADEVEQRELLETYRDFIHQQTYQKKPSRRQCFLLVSITGLNLTIFLISLVFLYRSVRLKHELTNNTNNILIKKTSIYSPVLDVLPLEYKNVQFNGSLFNPKVNPSIFRLPPSQEVDAAWWKISNPGPFVIYESDVKKIGKDPKTAVKVPASWGYGDDAYLADVDAFHQIHCLNVLRRSAFTNHEYYVKNGIMPHGHGHQHSKRSKVSEAHITHCVYTLLQVLQCQANTDISVYNWVKGQEHPYPDFAINHKCKNFDALVDWYYDNKLNLTLAASLTRPIGEDFIELEAPDEGIDDD